MTRPLPTPPPITDTLLRGVSPVLEVPFREDGSVD